MKNTDDNNDKIENNLNLEEYENDELKQFDIHLKKIRKST